MTKVLIDFVSDISCPWCIIGLRGLEQAISRLGSSVDVKVVCQPFELNPNMPAGGQDINEHLFQKYGSTPAQNQRAREAIAARGRDVGFTFQHAADRRIYNTFDAHRLLHWSEESGKQLALKNALFRLYFTENQDPGAPTTLLQAVRDVGLDATRAQEVLNGSEYAEEVRQRQGHYRRMGINGVPAIVINEKYLVQGSQDADGYEKILRQAVEASATGTNE